MVNSPGFPGECFICEFRRPNHSFRWKHNKLFLLLPEEYGQAFPVIVNCYTSPPTLVWSVPLLSDFSGSYGVFLRFVKTTDMSRPLEIPGSGTQHDGVPCGAFAWYSAQPVV